MVEGLCETGLFRIKSRLLYILYEYLDKFESVSFLDPFTMNMLAYLAYWRTSMKKDNRIKIKLVHWSRLLKVWK